MVGTHPTKSFKGSVFFIGKHLGGWRFSKPIRTKNMRKAKLGKCYHYAGHLMFLFNMFVFFETNPLGINHQSYGETWVNYNLPTQIPRDPITF